VAEPRTVPEDFRRCYGWAYEACGAGAVWVGIEVQHNGSWSAEPLCLKHAAMFLDDPIDWVTKPESRTLIEVSLARAIWRTD
jgi:hypothetical protein